MNSILELPGYLERVDRVSVEDYHRLPERNANGRQTELLRGIIIEKMPKSPLHKSVTTRLYRHVLSMLPAGFCAWLEQPLTFADSEPEPDISIARGEWSDFDNEHSRTAALAVEVAISTLAEDRELATLYAENGVEEYWIIQPHEAAVEVYRRPENGRYRESRLYGADDELICTSVPGLRLAIREILPPLS